MNTLLIAMLFGGFVMLLVWQVSMIFYRLPASDRRFYDRPAPGFRIIWPLLRLFVVYGTQYVPEMRKEEISGKLKQAGVDFTMSADEFIAARWSISLLLVVVAATLWHDSTTQLLTVVSLATLTGYNLPMIWLRERIQQRQVAIVKALPFYLDVITLAVESGSNLTGGMTKAVQKTTDSPLRREISRVLRDIRSGKPRAQALQELSDRTAIQSIGQIVSGLIQAEKTGASLGPMLRAQAEQLRNQRFQKAEKKAMEAPVKLLAPLFIFIFPTTFLTLGFVLVSKGIMEGFVTWSPLIWAYGWPGVG